MRTKLQTKKGRETSSLSEQARRILRVLLEQARQPDAKVTYGELARRTGIANCALRVPMDHLSDTLEDYGTTAGKHIPPIQVMIVNSKTGVPGPGASRHIKEPYLNGVSYQDLTIGEQKSLIAEIRGEIARYPGWEKVEQELTVPAVSSWTSNTSPRAPGVS
jgi:hypothetical protein